MKKKKGEFPSKKNQFKKGHKGYKPKGRRHFKTVLREILENYEADYKGKKIDGYQAIIIKMFKKAVIEEDLASMKEIINRLDGMPVQKQDIEVSEAFKGADIIFEKINKDKKDE